MKITHGILSFCSLLHIIFRINSAKKVFWSSFRLEKSRIVLFLKSQVQPLPVSTLGFKDHLTLFHIYSIVDLLIVSSVALARVSKFLIKSLQVLEFLNASLSIAGMLEAIIPTFSTGNVIRKERMKVSSSSNAFIGVFGTSMTVKLYRFRVLSPGLKDKARMGLSLKALVNKLLEA